ncbi:MAG: LysR family transcriptional regulator [Planctomycetes bacterium]|nr:LysR family transcriptional regulator [Planctomycetota bacterium]
MHIETLKIFCDLVELKSFSKTADKNLLSQSAISQQLAQLELSHKCQLVNRKKRPIELTREGHLLYQAAREILDRYEQFKSELNTLNLSAVSRINVAAIYSIGMHTLAAYVKKFMVNYPDVNVHIEYFSADKIYESILAGDFDIGLVAVPRKDKRLEVYDFEDEPLVLVCSPKHPLANETLIDIHKIQFEKFINFAANVPTRVWIDSILHRYSVMVQPVMEFDNVETTKRAIEINSGISILPKTTVTQELAAGTLKAVEFSNEKFTRPTGIVIRKDRIFGQATRYFIELLQKKVS